MPDGIEHSAHYRVERSEVRVVDVEIIQIKLRNVKHTENHSIKSYLWIHTEVFARLTSDSVALMHWTMAWCISDIASVMS